MARGAIGNQGRSEGGGKEDKKAVRGYLIISLLSLYKQCPIWINGSTKLDKYVYT